MCIFVRMVYQMTYMREFEAKAEKTKSTYLLFLSNLLINKVFIYDALRILKKRKVSFIIGMWVEKQRFFFARVFRRSG